MSIASKRVSSARYHEQIDTASEDDDEEEEELVLDNDNWSSGLPDRLDVLGLGQAMVDFPGVVDDEFLESLGIEKGTRKLVNHEERGRVLRSMDGWSYKAAAGESLSNILVALARLGSANWRPCLECSHGRAKLRRENVNFLTPAVKNGTTGTVIALTTPDTYRTMLSYQGTSSRIDYDPCLAGVISKTNILVVEGYLLELPDTIKTIIKACEVARSSGALVAVTASDIFCIVRHYDNFWEILENYVYSFFANTDEVRAFCHFSSKESPIASTRYLSHFIPLVSVTDGSRGSYIGIKGEAVYIPPTPRVPVWTLVAQGCICFGYSVCVGTCDS